MSFILLTIGSALTAVWGVSHLFPTKNVVKGFGDISEDNKNIITMEWIIEGVSLVFIGVIVFLVNYFDATSMAAFLINVSTIAMLCILSIISLFTAFKITFIPFKLCPIIFTCSAVLILLGILLK